MHCSVVYPGTMPRPTPATCSRATSSTYSETSGGPASARWRTGWPPWQQRWVSISPSPVFTLYLLNIEMSTEIHYTSTYISWYLQAGVSVLGDSVVIGFTPATAATLTTRAMERREASLVTEVGENRHM